MSRWSTVKHHKVLPAISEVAEHVDHGIADLSLFGREVKFLVGKEERRFVTMTYRRRHRRRLRRVRVAQREELWAALVLKPAEGGASGLLVLIFSVNMIFAFNHIEQSNDTEVVELKTFLYRQYKYLGLTCAQDPFIK